MLSWIQHHGFEMLLMYFIFNCAVSPLPKPKDEAGFYSWLYGFLHGILNLVAGNLYRIPQVRQFLGQAPEAEKPVANEPPKV